MRLTLFKRILLVGLLVAWVACLVVYDWDGDPKTPAGPINLEEKQPVKFEVFP